MSEFSKNENEPEEKIESQKRIGVWNMTLGVDDAKVPEKGYLYATDKESGAMVSGDDVGGWAGFEEELGSFMHQNFDKLVQGKGELFVGVWQDEDEFYHFDIVKVTESEAEALQKAEENGQQAIYDLENKKVIYIKK